MAGFEQAWTELEPPARRCLELAYQGLVGGGLPVGAVLAEDGEVVAEGRNRAYDPGGGGPDLLRGTPLAHAELNALAVVRTEHELAPCTLWSSHQPCSMCAAAAAFTGVGRVRYVAPDPWAVAADPTGTADQDRSEPLGDPRWATVAGMLFLLGVSARLGPESATVAGNRARQPAVTALALDLLAAGTLPATLPELVAPVWPRVVG
jgi:tRNA(Arg) A34 adenosine deaminase TadA